MQLLEPHCSLLDHIAHLSDSPGDVWTLEFEKHLPRVLFLDFVSTFNYLESRKKNADCKCLVLGSGVRSYTKICSSFQVTQAAACAMRRCSPAPFTGSCCSPEPSRAISLPNC